MGPSGRTCCELRIADFGLSIGQAIHLRGLGLRFAWFGNPQSAIRNPQFIMTPIVAVLAGGTSAEREVSLGSGRSCALALSRSFPTRLFEVNAAEIPDGVDPAKHVVFSTLHGTFG